MRSPGPAAATVRHPHQRRDSDSSSSDSDSESEDNLNDNHPRNHPPHHAKENGSWLQQRRLTVAREIRRDREQRVMHLHETKARHYVDHCFSFLMGNLAVVSLVLGVVYRQRTCDKPLAVFLVILGCLAPFAACTPILVRQWFYLHLRCNIIATGVFFMAFLATVWLLVGQQWAFASSPTNCDDELSAAANAVVFLMFVATLAYAAKVAWYLLLRARYSYGALWRSCWRDPYPDALAVSETDFLALEAIVVSTPTAPSAAGVRHGDHS